MRGRGWGGAGRAPRQFKWFEFKFKWGGDGGARRQLKSIELKGMSVVRCDNTRGW